MKTRFTMLVAVTTSTALIFGSAIPAAAAAGPAATAKIINRVGIQANQQTDGQNRTASGAQGTGLNTQTGVRQRVTDAAIQKLRDRALKAIDRRIRALERELQRARNMQRITEEDKNYLIGEIQSNIDELGALRSKIEQDSDLATLKADVKSIVTNFRIYVVVLPKGLALMAADRANWGSQRFDALAAKIQERIDKAKAAGKDVTEVQGLLDQFKAKIADAKAHIEQAREAFKSMLPVDPGGARSALQAGKTHLKEARADFKTAIGILKQIVAAFKEMKAPETTSTP